MPQRKIMLYIIKITKGQMYRLQSYYSMFFYFNKIFIISIVTLIVSSQNFIISSIFNVTRYQGKRTQGKKNVPTFVWSLGNFLKRLKLDRTKAVPFLH